MEKDGHAGKTDEKPFPTTLFILITKVSDLIGMIPPVFPPPKSRLFGVPFHFNRFSRHSRENPYGLRPGRFRAQEDWPGLCYALLFILITKIPDLIGMVPPVFPPKKQAFRGPLSFQ